MKLDERHDVVARIGRGGVLVTLDDLGLEGCLAIGVRRTLIAPAEYGLLPDLGAAEVRPADVVGQFGRSEFVVPVWRGDAIWLDLTLSTDTALPVRVSRDAGPESTCLAPYDPWIDRCRRLDGSLAQMTAPAEGASRIDIRVGGSDVEGGRLVSLHLVDAMALVQVGLDLPGHDPLEPIDYAEHNVPWPFDQR
jgi:hypothetical protein